MMVKILQVIQKRTNGYVGFYRDWKAYKDGFGDLQKDFWLGEVISSSRIRHRKKYFSILLTES